MTYRDIINDLRRLRLEYQAATDIKSKNEIDRKAAAVAAKCYDVMGDKYFERDEITGLRRGSINMHRLSQHHYSIHKILEDTIEWRKRRLARLKHTFFLKIHGARVRGVWDCGDEEPTEHDLYNMRIVAKDDIGYAIQKQSAESGKIHYNNYQCNWTKI